MSENDSSGRAVLAGLLPVGIGWLLGLVAYDWLIRFMLDRDWLVQSEALTPDPFAPWLLVAGPMVGLAIGVADAGIRPRPERSVMVSRFLVAAGVGLAGLGLFHAHAVGQLWVQGPDAVWLKDLLYHGPGIALIVAGHWSRPVRAPQPVA